MVRGAITRSRKKKKKEGWEGGRLTNTKGDLHEIGVLGTL